MGHGQIRHNLGLISHRNWFERLTPYLAGVHIHDVASPACDHIMPPRGQLDFPDFANVPEHTGILVLEPRPGIPPEHISNAREYLKEVWSNK